MRTADLRAVPLVCPRSLPVVEVLRSRRGLRKNRQSRRCSPSLTSSPARTAPAMKLTAGLSLFLPAVYAFQTVPSFGVSRVGRHAPTTPFSIRHAATDELVPLPVNPSAGDLSRTVSFSPSGLEDLKLVESVLQEDQVGKACVLVIPSWRHHLVQYDCLSACLEALKIPTTVQPLPDGLWAFLLQRLQVHSLRKAARKGVLEDLIAHALLRPFDYLDLALRKHSDRNHGRRITVIAPDDSAWLVRAFVNSRSTEWLKEVPLDTAVFVGGYHKSIVGELALDVFPNRPRASGSSPLLEPEGRSVRFFSLNDRKGGRVEEDGDAVGLEASISCMSFEEDTESCILQEYQVESSGWLSLLGSTSLLSLWVPRVFGG